MRQFVVVKFQPGDRRTYTYHNDGAPVAAGDRVVVDTAKGRSKVDVVSVETEAPRFPTKAIVGPVEKAPAS